MTGKSTRRFFPCIVIAGIMGPMGAATAEAQAPQNDYPTDVRADYVFGCMAANGQTPDILRRCSCSIDVLASLLSYDDYIRASTVLGTLQAGGRRVEMFRSTFATDMVRSLRQAQTEAEVRCF